MLACATLASTVATHGGRRRWQLRLGRRAPQISRARGPTWTPRPPGRTTGTSHDWSAKLHPGEPLLRPSGVCTSLPASSSQVVARHANLHQDSYWQDDHAGGRVERHDRHREVQGPGQGGYPSGPAAVDLRGQAARGRPHPQRLQHPEGEHAPPCASVRCHSALVFCANPAACVVVSSSRRSRRSPPSTTARSRCAASATRVCRRVRPTAASASAATARSSAPRRSSSNGAGQKRRRCGLCLRRSRGVRPPPWRLA